MKKPELIVLTGPMYAGKSSKLISIVDRFKYQKKNIVVIKPEIDDRYDVDHVVTHSGLKVPAICVSSCGDVYDRVLKALDDRGKVDVVVVDEMFMVDGIAETLVELYRTGITVVVAGLNLTATVKPFKEMEKLLPWATKVEVCPAVCSVCHDDAYYTYAKVELDGDINVGGDEMYEPRCAKCHPAFSV